MFWSFIDVDVFSMCKGNICCNDLLIFLKRILNICSWLKIRNNQNGTIYLLAHWYLCSMTPLVYKPREVSWQQWGYIADSDAPQKPTLIHLHKMFNEVSVILYIQWIIFYFKFFECGPLHVHVFQLQYWYVYFEATCSI